YVGYNPYMADLANPGVPNALFTLAFLCSFDCLRQRDLAGFTLAMILASLVLYAGPVLFLLTLTASLFFQPVPRADIRRWGRIGCSILLLLSGLYLIVGLYEGVFWTWVDTL